MAFSGIGGCRGGRGAVFVLRNLSEQGEADNLAERHKPRDMFRPGCKMPMPFGRVA
jgi:hypothetical protein